MTDSFDERRKAAEESYFQKQEQEALKRLKAKQEANKPRLSPINGQPMEQITIQGIVVDRCVESGGIFLDSGELEEIVKASKTESASSWLDAFVGKIKL